MIDGLLNINKPPGPSSAAIVGQVKRLLPRKTKVGHAGTLDPFASGVLLILIGKCTRLSQSLMDRPKQYQATIKLGGTTPTDDPNSAETPILNAVIPTLEQITAALGRQVGTILQRPATFSAMKIGGRRAYDLARRGKAVDLAPRPVRIDSIDILDYQWPKVHVVIDCGRGTYIRSIARDLGNDLGVGGYLIQLCRTKVGEFTVDKAASMDQLVADGVETHIINSLEPLNPSPLPL